LIFKNKVIRDIYSNEKQVKLDKCMINNCNNILLNLLQNTLKHFNNIIKAYDVKIPKEIQLPEIKKITDDNRLRSLEWCKKYKIEYRE
jgi:hypothetical protein